MGTPGHNFPPLNISPAPSLSQWDLWDFSRGPQAGPMESISPTERAPIGTWAYGAAEFSRELDFNMFAGAD